MRIKNTFDLESDPSVPEKLRWGISRKLRGVSKILVGIETEPGKFKQVNAIDLTCKPRQRPVDDEDDIAEAVTKILHWQWEEQDPEDRVPLRFRITMQSVDETGKRSKPYFIYTYDGDGGELDAGLEEAQTLERDTYVEMLDMIRRMWEATTMHNQELQNSQIRLAELAAQPVASCGELLKYSGHLALQGFQALVQATQLQYSEKKMELEEEAKTERARIWSERFGKYAEVAVAQGVPFILSKVVGPQRAEEMAHRMQEQMHEQAPVVEPSEEEEPTENDPPEPLLFIGALETSLTAEQRRDIRILLTKKEHHVLDALFCATTLEQAKEAVVQLGTVDPQKLLALYTLLSQDQQRLLGAAKEKLEKPTQEEKGHEDSPS